MIVVELFDVVLFDDDEPFIVALSLSVAKLLMSIIFL